jgi:plastocyanin
LALLAGRITCKALGTTLDVAASTADGHPVKGAVVTVFALAGGNKPRAATLATVDQVNLSFAPDLSVIPVGSAVEFPNSDSTSHQVYSFSSVKRFQLPLYRDKRQPPVMFEKPRIVTLGCNIHDDMLAHIVVTDAQFFGRTDAAGVWKLLNLPPGKYRVRSGIHACASPRARSDGSSN